MATPFDNLLPGNRDGSLTGFIGQVLGNPSTQQQQGSATGQALSQLAELRSQGLPPQQALLKFFQTPQGQDFFAHAGPDGLKTLTDGLMATQPPAPTLHNLQPGGQLFSTDPNTQKTTMIAENPKEIPTPEKVVSFNYFAKLAKLPPEELKRMAALQIDPTKEPTEAGKAIDNLVTNYGLDARTGEALKAGQVKVLPLKNQFNEDTGAVSVVDLTNPGAPSVIMLNPKGKQQAANDVPNQPAPGTTPDTGAGTGVLPPSPEPKKQTIPEQNPAYFGNKASMFLGAGAVASTLGAASKLSEQISPNLIIPEGAKANDRQTMINTLRSDLAAMGQLGGGIGVNKGVLEGYLKLAPNGGVGESPHDAIQKAIRLHEHIEQEVEAEQAKAGDGKLTVEERKQSVARAEGWKRVLRDLPTYDEMRKMEEAIRKGTAGAPTIESAAGALVKAGSKAVTSAKDQATGIAKNNPELGVGPSIDFDRINDPKELLAVDPKTLNREQKIKLLRRLDALTKGQNRGK